MWRWTLLLMACGRAPVADGPVEVQAFSAALRAAAGDCGAEVWGRGGDRDALAGRCGDLDRAYADHHEAALGRSIAGDALLLAAARVADDVEQLQRAVVRPEHEGEADLLSDHLADSMPALQVALDRAGEADRGPPTGCVDDAELTRRARSELDRDRRALQNLQRIFTAYAARQAGAPHLLRRRSLEAHGRVAVVQAEQRAAAWTALCATGDAARLERVRSTLGPYRVAVDAYVRAATASLEGAAPDGAALDAAVAAWEAVAAGAG